MTNLKESARHKAVWIIKKFKGNLTAREILTQGIKPFEVVRFPDNMLVNTGINLAWTLICGGAGTAFNNANAYLGVGDSNTAAAASQTDLQAAVNKLREAMDSGFPTYGSSQKATFQATFGGSDANWDWEEAAVFNASSGGTMLNRKVQSLGTKVSGSTWQLSCEITLS